MGLDTPVFVTVIIFIFAIVTAVLGFLMPFFVLRIRNEMVEMNKNIRELIYVTKNLSTQPNKQSRNEIIDPDMPGDKPGHGEVDCVDCGSRFIKDDLQGNNCPDCGYRIM